MTEIGGRPLVDWAIRAALNARFVCRVVGTTDSPEIARAMADAGAEVPSIRPTRLAQELTPDSPVFLYVLDLLAAEGYVPDIVVNVRPTTPLRTSADIDSAIQALLDAPGARSVKSVSLATSHPYKTWRLGGDGLLEALFPRWHAEFGNDPDVPRQALPVVYRSNGAVDAVWTTALRETSMFHPGPIAAYIMDPVRSVDIDLPADLDFARHVSIVL